MLLEFRTKNYKTFREEVIFSMIPAPKQKGLDYSVFSQQIDGKEYKSLPTAIVYGANASGKTNLIGAMDTFRKLILRGNINNSDNVNAYHPNLAAFNLELIPNMNAHGEPTDFSIKFIEDAFLIEYSISIDLGVFLDKNSPRKILEEELIVNGEKVFKRGMEVVDINFPKCIKGFLNNNIYKNETAAREIAQSGLKATDLFLTNGFKTIFSQILFDKIMHWIKEKFTIVYSSNVMHTNAFLIPNDNKVHKDKILTEAARVFGICSSSLGHRRAMTGEQETVLCSVLEHKNIAMPATAFESYGTIRFVNEFPLIIKALLYGGTLVADEFDASIHPMALMNIINNFHNDEINKNHAQLVFNTHNPIFLNANLFRRDEIKFVERDDNTNESTHYSLSDFKTAGKNGVRNGADYMKNYFVSQYGAIRDIDFSPLLEQLINKIDGTKNG